MTVVEQMARFVHDATLEDVSPVAVRGLKIRILDALGCAIGALAARPIQKLRQHLEDFGGRELCSLIGGGKSSPDQAALLNGALVRHLDFNDAYLSRGETCHPSDNLAPILAASEYTRASGATLLTALAVAYQIQCRLADEAPVRALGFDFALHGAYASAAGVARALGLDSSQTAHAIAIAGTSLNPLRVTRTGSSSHWSDLASPFVAAAATRAAFLAMRGITGPLHVIEGNKGLVESITGKFQIHWAEESLERVRRTVIKKYDADIHAQSTLEAIAELCETHDIDPEDIELIDVETFDVAFHIIGGGEEGARKTVHSREDAEKSLPYMVAVALLDGEVTPAQYRTERLAADDVQALLRRVHISPNDEFSRRFPDQMPTKVRVIFKDGTALQASKNDYEGFMTRPASWEQACAKFERLAYPFTDGQLRLDVIAAIDELDDLPVMDLMALLERIQPPAAGRSLGSPSPISPP